MTSRPCATLTILKPSKKACTIGGSKEDDQGHAPPDQIFMQSWAIRLQNKRSLGVDAPLPQENPGSATAWGKSLQNTLVRILQFPKKCRNFLIDKVGYIWSVTLRQLSVVDLGGVREMPPPVQFNFFHFHAVFGKKITK